MSDTLNPAPDGQDNGNNSTPYQKFLEQISTWKGPEMLLDVQMLLFPDLLTSLQAGELSQTGLSNLWGVLSRNRVGRRDDLSADFEKYAATHTPDPGETAQPEMSEEDKQAALELLRCPDLIYKAVQTIGTLGVEGETKNRALLFLAVVSRLTEEIISILVKGLSSGGKSNLVKRTLALFPKNAYYEFTAMSTKALIYADLDLRNRFLVIFEEDGNEEAQYIVCRLGVDSGG